MRIPTFANADGTTLIASPSATSYDSVRSFKSHDGYRTGDWSSLIGIVTAICGNVLISVALNLQRYAHIKLNKQYAERQRLLRRAQRRAERTGGYGTQQVSRSKERARQGVRNGYRYLDNEQEDLINGQHFEEEEEDATESEPLLSSSMYSEGTERPSDVGEEVSEEAAQKSYLKSPYWWAGIILMTIGEAGNFLAYGFAPASIVSPLGVVALISNCIIAPFFLKEKFRKRDLFGVITAVAGAVTVVLSASDSNPKLGPHEIWMLISRWEFETYFGITVAVIICLMWASTKYGGKSIFIDLGLVGLFGGYTALSTKGVASMLSYTLLRALTFPVTYLLVLVLVSTAIMQIKYVNRALKRFDATQVIPTQFVLFTLSVILGSAVLYRDFEKESGEDAGKFIGGCAMTFAGVWLITSAREREPDEEEGFEEDEEAINLVPEERYRDLDFDDRPKSRRALVTPAISGEEPSANGHRPTPLKQPSTSSLPEALGTHEQDYSTPRIVRIQSGQSTSFLDDEPSQPASMAEPSPLVENPWLLTEEHTPKAKRSIQRLLRPLSKIFPHHDSQALPSTLKTTNSEPILPTEAQFQSSPPHTPTNPYIHDDPLAAPITPHTADGSHLLSRHSIADLIPGPFTSTLSSPLSAIVADSLRRGVDVSSLKPKRRRRLPGMPRSSGLRERGNSETDARSEVLADASSSSLPTEESQQSDGSRNRVRSLSGTFGDLFRSVKMPRRESVAVETEPSEPTTPVAAEPFASH